MSDLRIPLAVICAALAVIILIKTIRALGQPAARILRRLRGD